MSVHEDHPDKSPQVDTHVPREEKPVDEVDGGDEEEMEDDSDASEESDAEEGEDEDVAAVATRHSRRLGSKENQEEMSRLMESQKEIRQRKIEELKARLLGQESTNEPTVGARRGGSLNNRLTNFVAYDSPSEVPAETLKKYRMHVDQRREVLFVPLSNGNLLPVNIRCIKNLAKSDESGKSASMRLMFHTPGAALAQSDLFPQFKPEDMAKTVFLKEMGVPPAPGLLPTETEPSPPWPEERAL
jgi:nucleosome binding factor SPN SPT16 subunit